MSAQLTCTREGCAAPGGGACLNGHTDPQDCPDSLYLESAEEVERPADPIGRPLRADDSLGEEEATQLMSRGQGIVVLPLGSRDVGKTTLVLELYARFLKKRTGSLSFARSETLLMYERVILPSRLESSADLPVTFRTRLDDSDRPYVHLGIRQDGGVVTDLLFVNVSGEYSDRVADGASPGEELLALSFASKVLICVDGAEVAASASRCDLVVSQNRQLLRSIAEQTDLPPAAEVAVVLTKWDEVFNDEPAQERWEVAERELLTQAERLGRKVQPFRVASRRLASQPPDDGLGSLLAWLIERPPVPSVEPPPASAPTRAMGVGRGADG